MRDCESKKCVEETMEQSVAMREKWEVSYARFLNVPTSLATEDATAAYPRLQVRRITKTCKEHGTWLTASSSADLKLIVDSYNADVVMRVHYHGRIMEEHFISKLNISWPQVSCESGFPPRATRVVIVTYKDEMEEVQKFAFQFSTICSLETFLNALKAYMKDARRTLHTNFGRRSDVSTPQIYKPVIDFYSRTPLTSLSTQDNGTYARELASISSFNKRRFTSEKFYQQAVVEVSRASSCKKIQTPKSLHQKTRKRLADSLPTMLKSQHCTSNADSEADNANNQAMYAGSQDKDTAYHQSKMLISVDESIHIGTKPMGTRLQRINEFFSKPISWHESSEAVTEDNSHYRTPAVSNCEVDEASDTQNPVPSSLGVELEQCQQQQDTPTNNHNSLEAFPPSFTALLSNCYSSSEKAAAQSPKVVEDDLKAQIARYMDDSSFQDMLMKVERVIDELGYKDVLES